MFICLGADVTILSTGSDLLGLYFSTPQMRNAMTAWPEIVFMDGTYNLLDTNLVTMILMVEDSNGISEIVCIGLLTNEKYDTIKWFLETFKKENLEACSRMKCMMTDKDLLERNVIKKVFPHISTYICLFHTLKTFSRQIKTADMQITGQNKDEFLKILQKLAYSSSEQEYNEIYKIFCKTASNSVLKYFNDNWHNIFEEWTLYNMTNGTMNNRTNNRLENLNGKLKLVIARKSTLVDFINSFFIWDESHKIETCAKALKNFFKKPPVNYYTHDEQSYYDTLTDKGFEFVREELRAVNLITIKESDSSTQTCTIQSKSLTMDVSTTACQCAFYKSSLLPCRHLLATRKYFGLNLFLKDLCPVRWSNQFYKESFNAVHNTVPTKPIEKSNDILLSEKNVKYDDNIRLPQVIKNKRRPKGSSLTAIGRFKSKGELAYTKKSKIDKIKTMMHWLSINHEMIIACMNNEYLIELKDINLYTQQLKDSFMENEVNINLLKPYLANEAWKKFEQLVETKRKNNVWTCNLCNEACKDETIFCDSCNCWFHKLCVGIKRKPKTKFWFCSECQTK